MLVAATTIKIYRVLTEINRSSIYATVNLPTTYKLNTSWIATATSVIGRKNRIAL